MAKRKKLGRPPGSKYITRGANLRGDQWQFLEDQTVALRRASVNDTLRFAVDFFAERVPVPQQQQRQLVAGRS